MCCSIEHYPEHRGWAASCAEHHAPEGTPPSHTVCIDEEHEGRKLEFHHLHITLSVGIHACLVPTEDMEDYWEDWPVHKVHLSDFNKDKTTVILGRKLPTEVRTMGQALLWITEGRGHKYFKQPTLLEWQKSKPFMLTTESVKRELGANLERTGVQHSLDAEARVT